VSPVASVALPVAAIVALPASLSLAVVVSAGSVGPTLVGALVLPWLPVEASEVAPSVALPVEVAGVLEQATRSDPQTRINGASLPNIGGV